MAWLDRVSIWHRTLWLWWRLYYTYIVLKARAVQNKHRSDVGRLLPFGQITYSRYSFCVTFVTALGWGMIPDPAQGLPIQSSPTRLSTVFWQSEPAGWLHPGSSLYNLQQIPDSFWGSSVCSEVGTHLCVWTGVTWRANMLPMVLCASGAIKGTLYLNPPSKN